MTSSYPNSKVLLLRRIIDMCSLTSHNAFTQCELASKPMILASKQDGYLSSTYCLDSY